MVPFPSCVHVLLFELPVFVRGIIPFYLLGGDVKGSDHPVRLLRGLLAAAAADLIDLVHASGGVVQGGAEHPEETCGDTAPIPKQDAPRLAVGLERAVLGASVTV